VPCPQRILLFGTQPSIASTRDSGRSHCRPVTPKTGCPPVVRSADVVFGLRPTAVYRFPRGRPRAGGLPRGFFRPNRCGRCPRLYRTDENAGWSLYPPSAPPPSGRRASRGRPPCAPRVARVLPQSTPAPGFLGKNGPRHTRNPEKYATWPTRNGHLAEGSVPHPEYSVVAQREATSRKSWKYHRQTRRRDRNGQEERDVYKHREGRPLICELS
jgi:hypothetical protein